MDATYSNAPDLDDTSERQAALRRYHILDTAPEKNFDRITSLVAKVCEVPTALITLIDEERQWFKSCFGFDARETDIGVSFCVHAVHQGKMLVVEDATKDPRFKDNPIVTGPPHIRFYAGAPLTTPEGIHIGTLCIIDYEPQPFDAAQREILDRLADVVVNQFELRSAEAQVRQLVEHNPQPMYVYAQSDNRLLNVNEAAREQYGYDDFSSVTVGDLEAPVEDQPSSEPLSMHERADGSFFPVRVREQKVLFNGRAAVLAVPQSVTERRDTDTTVFFQTDLEGTTQSLSAEWEDVTGFSIRDTVGSSFLDFVHPLDRSSTADVFSALLDGEMDSCQHETSILTAEGAQNFELHARLVHDANGTPAGAAGTLTPVIEQEEAAPAGSVEEEADAPSAMPGTEDEDAVDMFTPTPPTDETDAGSSSHRETGAPAEEASAASAERGPAPETAPGQAASASTPGDSDDESAAPDSAPVVSDPTSDEEPAASDESAPSKASTSSESAPDTSERDEEEASKNSVFSADLPTFADAEPTSPSAPIGGSNTDDTGTNAASEGDGDETRELSPEPFDFVARLHEILDTQTLVQQDASLRRMLPDGSIPVRLDPSAIRDLVESVLDIVQIHTNAGTITVRARREDDEVLLHVEDDSMDEPAPERLQSPRRLVQQLDGTLTVEGAAEGGTQFRLTLPRSSAPRGDGSASILSDSSLS